jgi:F-type H+-transporting ATPase subunit alpha
MSTSHIVENLRKEIENWKSAAKVEKVGHVLELFDGIARVSGLSDIKSSEMVAFPGGVVALH